MRARVIRHPHYWVWKDGIHMPPSCKHCHVKAEIEAGKPYQAECRALTRVYA